MKAPANWRSDSDRVKEGALNRVAAAIRACDPCLGGSTHAGGRMPLLVLVMAPDGTGLRQVCRS